MDYAGPVERSVMIAGHLTSVSLEPAFWEALKRAAREEGVPLSALVARIDAERLHAPAPPNLGSALRQWLFARAGTGFVIPAEAGISGREGETVRASLT